MRTWLAVISVLSVLGAGGAAQAPQELRSEAALCTLKVQGMT